MAYHILEVFWHRHYRPVMRQVDPHYFRHFTEMMQAFKNAAALDDSLEVDDEDEALAAADYLWQQFKAGFGPRIRRQIEAAELRQARDEAA